MIKYISVISIRLLYIMLYLTAYSLLLQMKTEKRNDITGYIIICNGSMYLLVYSYVYNIIFSMMYVSIYYVYNTVYYIY